MATGAEVRSTIDTETVRGLLLINGGGAVALLAFIPGLLQKPEFELLTRAVISAVFIFQVGLGFAIIHNRLRRKCSLAYVPPPENRKLCQFRGKTLAEPCVCHWSIGFMWLSIVAFFVGGLIVLVSGLCFLSTPQSNGLIYFPVSTSESVLQKKSAQGGLVSNFPNFSAMRVGHPVPPGRFL